MTAATSQTPVADAVRRDIELLGTSNFWAASSALVDGVRQAHMVNVLTAITRSSMRDADIMLELTKRSHTLHRNRKALTTIRDTVVLLTAGAPVDPLEARWP